MHTKNPAKKALDNVIRKSRVHLYKPIQIAEILFRHRSEKNWNLNDLESYRNVSKRWRDEISLLLVGRKSTSSQKYQDNIFEANAMPPKLLAELGKINKPGKGFVEAYIYKALKKRLSSVHAVDQYINSSIPKNFSLRKLITLFKSAPGLRRSIDKIYEILVYALFASIVRALKVQVVLEIKNKDKKIIEDFKTFIKMVLGIDNKRTKLILPALLYRVGITNAADRGLDILANFGLAIQVKHLALTTEIVEDIADNITTDRIVIVCLDAEKQMIVSLLKQVGLGAKIQGITTMSDLDNWYKLCLSKQYQNTLGKKLLIDLQREFSIEFPSIKEIDPFIKERGYDKIIVPSDWSN